MLMRYWFIYLFLHLIDKVSLQDSVSVKGVVGGSVILPCTYKEGKLNPEEIYVFWRSENETKVYDIENGIPLTEKQDAMFKGRIKGPSEYADGNFSLIFSNLRLTDGGKFFCSIPKKLKRYEVTLQVRAVPTTVSTPKSTVNERSSSTRPQPEGIATFLLLLLFWSVVFCTVSE